MMAGFKEIRSKIRSVESTRKITKAMEMVAVSKMRKARERMQASRPYADRVRNIAGHLAEANPDYVHPFMMRHETVRRAGLIVITTDKGLCGGMNVNVLRLVTNRMRQYADQGVAVDVMAVATDNAGNVIGELSLLYNKSRQASITQEITEIVSGAAAV